MAIETTDQQIEDVIAFWRHAGPAKWFTKDEHFDAEIRQRFMLLWEKAAGGELDHWQNSVQGTLALLLVLDQFPRNMFRNNARAFSTDAKARLVAKSTIERGFDQHIAPDLRAFVYLPFEHSEDLQDQKYSMMLFQALGDENYLRYAQIHQDIIEQFGRFPHRNKVLGRKSTPAEQAFLDNGGFAA